MKRASKYILGIYMVLYLLGITITAIPGVLWKYFAVLAVLASIITIIEDRILWRAVGVILIVAAVAVVIGDLQHATRYELFLQNRQLPAQP